MIWKLTKLSYLGSGGFSSHLNITTKKDKASSKFGVALLLAFMGIFFAYMFFSSAIKMFTTGTPNDYIVFFGTLFIFVFFFIFSSSDNTFIKSHELQMLSTLPVTKRQLFVSRVNMMLIEGYVLSLLSFSGMIVASILYGKISLKWILCSILFYMTIPLFLTTISAMLSLFLSEKPFARKIKRVVYYAILLAFSYVYIIFYSKSIDFEVLLNHEVGGSIPNSVMNVMVCTSIFFIALFVAMLPMMEKKFLNVREEESNKVKKENETALVAKSPRSALFYMEWNRLIAESAFSFELIGEIMMPIIMLLMFGITDAYAEMDILGLIQRSPNSMLLVIVSILGFSSFNGVSSTSFSREGRDYYLLESLPITRRDRYMSKVLFHFFAFVPFDALLLIAAGLILKFPIWFYPLSILSMSFFSIATSFIGLNLDRNAPYLDWTSAQMAVKNNMNNLKVMPLSLLVEAAAFVPGFIYASIVGPGIISLAIPTVILFIMMIAIYFKNIK